MNVTIPPELAIELIELLCGYKPASSASAKLLSYIEKASESGTKLDDQAAELYEMYPRKAARPHAIRAIKTAIKKIGFELLREQVEKYAAHHKRDAIEMRFTPMPATWFNGERWNDTPVTAAPVVNPKARIGELRLGIRNSRAFKGGPYYVTYHTTKEAVDLRAMADELRSLNPGENLDLLRT